MNAWEFQCALLYKKRFIYFPFSHGDWKHRIGHYFVIGESNRNCGYNDPFFFFCNFFLKIGILWRVYCLLMPSFNMKIWMLDWFSICKVLIVWLENRSMVSKGFELIGLTLACGVVELEKVCIWIIFSHLLFPYSVLV